MAGTSSENLLEFWHDLNDRAEAEVRASNGGKLDNQKLHARMMELMWSEISNPVDFNLAMTKYVIPGEFLKVLETARQETVGEKLPCVEYQQQEFMGLLLGSRKEEFIVLKVYSERFDLPKDNDHQKEHEVLVALEASLYTRLKTYLESHRDLRVFGDITHEIFPS